MQARLRAFCSFSSFRSKSHFFAPKAVSRQRLSILVFLLIFDASGYALIEMRTVSEEMVTIDGELESLGPIVPALGVIQWQSTIQGKTCQGNRCRIIQEKISHYFSGQSGFFIRPDLFVTAESPDDAKRTIADRCDDQTLIGSGLFEMRLRKFTPKYKCKEVVLNEPGLGIAVLRVVNMDGSPADHKHTLPMVPANYTLSSSKPFSILGYSFEGRLFYSSKCFVDSPVFEFPRELTARNPSIKLKKGAWAKMQCWYRSGMSGSPILVRQKDEWRVAGLVSTLTDKAGSAGDFDNIYLFDSLIFPKLASIQVRLGSLLFGGEVMP